MCETYLLKTDIALDSDDFMFRSLSFFKSKDTYRLCKINKSLSYTRARELLLEALTQVGLEKTKFRLHSLRSGGVSEAAYNRIPERLLKAHGRWKSDIAKDGYIKENMRNRLFLKIYTFSIHFNLLFLCLVELVGANLIPFKS
jgi:hypothetical protein